MKLKRLKINFFVFCFLFFLALTSKSTAYAVPEVWDVLRNEFTLNHDTSRAEVQAQIRWLVAHPSYLQKVCRQSEPYIYHILGEIKKRKLPGELALIPMIESAYDPFVYSGSGAAGLWQLMPRTGSDLGLKQDWWFDGRRSIGPSTDAALNYLIYLNKFFNGNWIYAIASYESGEGTIARAVKASQTQRHTANFWDLRVSRVTQFYVPRLLALAEIINNPRRYHITLPEIPYLPYFEEVNIGSQIDLNHAAKMAGISYKELIKLNPGFNRWTTAPYKPFKLLIPTERVHQFNLNLANLPDKKRVSWDKHQVKPGDSLDNIAVRYHTTVNLIKQINQLTTNRIKPNQAILIPSDKPSTALAKRGSGIAKRSAKCSIDLMNNKRIIHIVKANENYQKLVTTYGVRARDIQAWNKLSRKHALHKGQKLIIWRNLNQGNQYIVKKGDNLGTIAQKHKTRITHIIALNPELKRNKLLQPGQRLILG